MEVIFAYTRAEAIADGVLVDVSDLAREAGFKLPVAMTAAAWADCVAWSEEDTRRKRCPQDETGRLWDVLFMAAQAARRRANTPDRLFQLLRVPREGRGQRPRLTTLRLVIGPGDEAEPVLTIMQPDED